MYDHPNGKKPVVPTNFRFMHRDTLAVVETHGYTFDEALDLIHANEYNVFWVEIGPGMKGRYINRITGYWPGLDPEPPDTSQV